MSQADAPAADWYPDPSGRFQFRYWDGTAWTGHVSTDGDTDWDPPADEGGDAGQADSGVAQQAAAQQATADATGTADAVQTRAEPAQAVDDSAYAPQPADASDRSEPHPGPAASEPQPADQQQVASQPAEPQGGTIEEGEPSDTNLVANHRAQVDDDVRAWLDEVAGQVEPRLSRINADWTSQPQAEAARACAYGLLVGHLAKLHPHMRPDLSQVAEAHPSFTTLEEGARLETLEQIARDPQRTAAWLGPLIGTEDVDRVQALFD